MNIYRDKNNFNKLDCFGKISFHKNKCLLSKIKRFGSYFKTKMYKNDFQI